VLACANDQAGQSQTKAAQINPVTSLLKTALRIDPGLQVQPEQSSSFNDHFLPTRLHEARQSYSPYAPLPALGTASARKNPHIRHCRT
jgi:hypothetical protein